MIFEDKLSDGPLFILIQCLSDKSAKLPWHLFVFLDALASLKSKLMVIDRSGYSH